MPNVVSELARSIETNGLLQPILVRPIERSYELVFGHHRFQACKLLKWKTIPAIVKEMPQDESFLTTLVENLQRNYEVNPLIEAKMYIELIGHGWTINRIAARIGKSDSYVSDRVGLVRRLDTSIAKKVEHNNNGFLKPSHLELLSRLKSKEKQLELARMIEKRRLSVRNLEKLLSTNRALREVVKAVGESLYVRLPTEIVCDLQIRAGQAVYIYSHSRGRVVLELSVEPTHENNLVQAVQTASNRSF